MTFLTSLWFTKPLWLWLFLFACVAIMLILDLGILHKKQSIIQMRESLILYSGYCACGVLFGGFVWWQLGANAAAEYFAGFIVEQSLAMDNVFAIALILGAFAVPRQYQHRILFWGILGVLILRGIMIGLGAILISKFAWILYIFGVFLIFSGIKLLLKKNKHEPNDLKQNKLLNWLKSHLPITDQFHGSKFWLKIDHKLYVTPLFLVLVLVEFADLIFAVDSVPAVFAITQDPYLVYSSNIFAILGLRALYFTLEVLIHRFVYLSTALALVLIFIGGKIFWHGFIGEVTPLLSIVVTLGLLAGGVILSLTRSQK